MKLIFFTTVWLCLPFFSNGAIDSELNKHKGTIELQEEFGGRLEIKGVLAKSIYKSLSEALEQVSYRAGCSVSVPGCASKVGTHIYCSNGKTGDSELNYRCYIDITNLESGEFRTR